jgi:hypothetical protein
MGGIILTAFILAVLFLISPIVVLINIGCRKVTATILMVCDRITPSWMKRED